MKYTQTTTAPISDAPEMPKSNNMRYFIIMLMFIIVLSGGYIAGRCDGESEAKQETLKQEQQQTQSQIKALDEQNKTKATEVRNESQKAVKQTKIIRDNAFVPMPEFKSSSQDTMIKYLKEARP